MSQALATVIVLCTGIVCLSAVLVLRPIVRRLGGYLDAATQERLRPAEAPEMARLREVLTRIDGRLDQIEERQDFAEALLSASDPRGIALPLHARPGERN